MSTSVPPHVHASTYPQVHTWSTGPHVHRATGHMSTCLRTGRLVYGPTHPHLLRSTGHRCPHFSRSTGCIVHTLVGLQVRISTGHRCTSTGPHLDSSIYSHLLRSTSPRVHTSTRPHVLPQRSDAEGNGTRSELAGSSSDIRSPSGVHIGPMLFLLYANSPRYSKF